MGDKIQQSIYFSEKNKELFERLTAKAEKEHRSFNEQVMLAVEEHLKR